MVRHVQQMTYICFKHLLYFLFMPLLFIHFTWNLHMISLSFLSGREPTVQTNIIMQLNTQLFSGTLWTQVRLHPCSMLSPYCCCFWHTLILKIQTNKCKQRKNVQLKDVTFCSHYTIQKGKKKTHTQLKHSYRWKHIWMIQQYYWACEDWNIPTNNTVTSSLLDLFPPNRLTVPRQ